MRQNKKTTFLSQLNDNHLFRNQNNQLTKCGEKKTNSTTLSVKLKKQRNQF